MSQFHYAADGTRNPSAGQDLPADLFVPRMVDREITYVALRLIDSLCPR